MGWVVGVGLRQTEVGNTPVLVMGKRSGVQTPCAQVELGPVAELGEQWTPQERVEPAALLDPRSLHRLTCSCSSLDT